MNNLTDFVHVLDGLKPWSGRVPKGYLADFMGTLIDVRFQGKANPEEYGGNFQEEHIPNLRDNAQGDAEWWFETVNWFASAQAARDRYVMISMGASYGAQAVGAYKSLQMCNPLPCKIVAVEGDPATYAWLRQHFTDNGIDPDEHWLLQAAVSDSNDVVFFPTGAPGFGANNCVSTNELKARRYFADELTKGNGAAAALRNLLLKNSTGIERELVPGSGVMGEIKFVSAVTIKDLLSPFSMVDYLESDIQQSEAIAFPPAMDILRKKVRRVHIGTHGKGVHDMLHALFAEKGWEIVFSYQPNSEHDSPLGRFTTNDGVLTALNPDLSAPPRA